MLKSKTWKHLALVLTTDQPSNPCKKPNDVGTESFLNTAKRHNTTKPTYSTYGKRVVTQKVFSCPLSNLWPLVSFATDPLTRSGCGQSPSWTSSSAWTRWRNQSVPQLSCYPAWQRFPWTNHLHNTTDCKRVLCHTVSTGCSKWPSRGSSNMSEVQLEVYLSRQGLFWACSFPAQPCYMCTVIIHSEI